MRQQLMGYKQELEGRGTRGLTLPLVVLEPRQSLCKGAHATLLEMMSGHNPITRCETSIDRSASVKSHERDQERPEEPPSCAHSKTVTAELRANNLWWFMSPSFGVASYSTIDSVLQSEVFLPPSEGRNNGERDYDEEKVQLSHPSPLSQLNPQMSH